jgi:hypothetical protein
MQVTDISFDLETLSNRFDSAILSIGAAEFNRHTGEIGRTLYVEIDLNEAIKRGHVEGSTLAWWMQQDDRAKTIFTSRVKEQFGTALGMVSEFVGQAESRDRELCVWGNGSSFDITILEHAFSKDWREIPWKFWNVRDMRTIVDVAAASGFDKKSIPFEGVCHFAKDDAIHQAKVISAAWRHLIPVTAEV